MIEARADTVNGRTQSSSAQQKESPAAGKRRKSEIAQKKHQLGESSLLLKVLLHVNIELIPEGELQKCHTPHLKLISDKNIARIANAVQCHS